MPVSSLLPLPRRIAVTGVGLVTPLGVGRNETWQGLLAGRPMVRWLDEVTPSPAPQSQPSQRFFGARVPLEIPAADRMISFAKLAAREAAAQADLSDKELREAACVIGTSKIDLNQLDHQLHPQAAAAERDSFINVLFPSSAAAMVAADLGCEGAALCPVAACATGLLSIIQAANLIRSGHCVTALAGGSDSSLHAGVLASYRRLGVLAKPGRNPANCGRPFDAQRSGFAVGEGAAVIVLEDWEHAACRGVPILAEWVDGLIFSDPADLVRADCRGIALQQLISRLLHRQGIFLDDISAVSLHGTGTILNDQAEGAALKGVFSGRKHPLEAFGLKGAIGHLMGAAGAVETAACVLGLAQQQLPPTVNHESPGQDLAGLPLQFNPSGSSKYRFILKLSLGFGGTLGAAVLKAPR